MSLSERLAAVERRYEELTAEMSRPEGAADHEQLGALARERATRSTVREPHRACRVVSPIVPRSVLTTYIVLNHAVRIVEEQALNNVVGLRLPICSRHAGT